ncbi:hypothetical protein ABZ845_07875 [Streptomyces sp. NPDC047022]|uniref:hypothetical protein n=1 Tax=Streptomyces sp. NPDC047022 TaxID=3155737 RepID=UPI003406D002
MDLTLPAEAIDRLDQAGAIPRGFPRAFIAPMKSFVPGAAGVRADGLGAALRTAGADR